MYILSCNSWIVAEHSLLLLWPVQRGMTELRGEFRRQVMFGRFLLLVLLLPLRHDPTKHCGFRPLPARLMNVHFVLVVVRACFLAAILHLQNRLLQNQLVVVSWCSANMGNAVGSYLLHAIQNTHIQLARGFCSFHLITHRRRYCR